MNLTNLTSAHFKQIISLLDKKESLQSQITDLDEKITSLLGGTSAGGASKGGGRKGSRRVAQRGATASKGARRKGGGGKRGALKESVIDALKSAGTDGISIREMSDKLGVKTANLHAWFGTTGKKLAGLKKIGPARYQLTAGGETEEG